MTVQRGGWDNFQQSSGQIELVENTGTYIYVGWATFGTSTGSAYWRIHRTTLSGSNITAVERADGNDNYDNEWDNRASLSYS